MSEMPIITLSPGVRNEEGLFQDFKDGQYLGGQVCMEAAAQLAEDYPLVLTGGYNETADLYSSRKTDGMARFIWRQVPDAQVTLVPSLPCTRHNFVAVFNKLAITGQIGRRVGLLTHEYHLPRAVALARAAWAATGQKAQLKITELAAEDLLDKPIEEIVRGREAEYQARLASEQAGLAQVKGGRYQDPCFLEGRLERLRFIMGRFPDVLLTAEEKALLLA